jgi:RND superfamily putative drug exporter
VLESLGGLIYRRRFATLALSALLLVLALVSLVRGGPLTGGSIAGLEANRAQTLVDFVSGRRSDTTFLVVFRPSARAGTLDAAAFRRAIGAALEPVRKDPRTLAVVSPDGPPSPITERLVNRAEGAALALVSLKGDLRTALKAYAGVRQELESKQLNIACTGKIPFTHDLNHTLEHDLLLAELVSLPLALLVLFFVFRTLTAAALPVGVGGLAVVCGIGLVLALAHHVEIAQYTINVCSLIGLGVAIDYSLFIVSRYREELERGHDYARALALALKTAGRVVLFSGFAVGTGLSGLLFFRGSYLFAMGAGGAIVVALAVVFALTFLPALLAVLGPRIHAGSLRRRVVAPSESRWHRMALFVMRRPLVTLIPTLAVLLLLGHPFLHLRLLSADVRVLDRSIEARGAYELLRRYFPEQAATRVEAAVEFPSGDALTSERVLALGAWVSELGKQPGVRAVESVLDVARPLAVTFRPSPGEPTPVELARLLAMPPPAVAARLAASPASVAATLPAAPPSGAASLPAFPPSGAASLAAGKALFARDRVTVVHVLSEGAPESETARNLVRWLRAHRAIGDGRVAVGGQTAADLDATHFMLSRAPYAAATIVGITVLVLFFLLHSVLLPMKAVVMNLLSITGSFGALVWLFQDGHLFVHEGRPLEPSLPVLLFCIVFGLSMDYEVLMLSRMKEAHDRLGDNALAVAEGLERSAGLITSAAAIMVTVFAAFALARVVLIQAVGVGMALAVALDATLVRVLLVPSTMRLFGELNWWAPRWLGARPPTDTTRLTHHGEAT